VIRRLLVCGKAVVKSALAESGRHAITVLWMQKTPEQAIETSRKQAYAGAQVANLCAGESGLRPLRQDRSTPMGEWPTMTEINMLLLF